MKEKKKRKPYTKRGVQAFNVGDKAGSRTVLKCYRRFRPNGEKKEWWYTVICNSCGRESEVRQYDLKQIKANAGTKCKYCGKVGVNKMLYMLGESAIYDYVLLVNEMNKKYMDDVSMVTSQMVPEGWRPR